MAHFNLTLIRPVGSPWSNAFSDAIDLVGLSLEDMGHTAKAQENVFDKDATNILFGYNTLYSMPDIPREKLIVYQLEQLGDNDVFNPEPYLQWLSACKAVWDYDPANVAYLESKGLTNVHHVPIGYHKKLEKIKDAPKQDIDVLHYGMVSERRRVIIKELYPQCNMVCLVGVYGKKRDALIARSKIVLNMHHYKLGLVEQVRVAYLLNNGRFVLTENSTDNPYQRVLAHAEYNELVRVCMMFLLNPMSRQRIAESGLEYMRERPMTKYLESVL